MYLVEQEEPVRRRIALEVLDLTPGRCRVPRRWRLGLAVDIDHAIVKEGQCRTWRPNARDWSISRNRFRGSPVRVWRSDDSQRAIVTGT